MGISLHGMASLFAFYTYTFVPRNQKRMKETNSEFELKVGIKPVHSSKWRYKKNLELKRIKFIERTTIVPSLNMKCKSHTYSNKQTKWKLLREKTRELEFKVAKDYMHFNNTVSPITIHLVC